MAVLKRGEIRKPVLAKETVAVPELGGDVVVRGMTLTERLALTATVGDDDIATYATVARVLSWCVLDADGKPALTLDEWEAFGSQHLEPALDLFATVKRLSLLTREDTEKKSASTPS